MIPAFDRLEQAVPIEHSQNAGGLIGSAMIMTALGERPVSSLDPGDRVITRNQGMVVLEDIRQRAVATPVVRIAARSLGHNRPEADTMVPLGQRILIRDWRAQALFGSKQALVPVERLVDGEFITLEEERALGLYDLLFDDPQILYVDGLELASYIDDYALF